MRFSRRSRRQRSGEQRPADDRAGPLVDPSLSPDRWFAESRRVFDYTMAHADDPDELAEARGIWVSEGDWGIVLLYCQQRILELSPEHTLESAGYQVHEVLDLFCDAIDRIKDEHYGAPISDLVRGVTSRLQWMEIDCNRAGSDGTRYRDALIRISQAASMMSVEGMHWF